jgi:hypothetical protein
MFDSFYDEDSKCPKCSAKITTDWQTKHLECLLESWQKGDFVQYRKLERIPEEERKRDYRDRRFAPIFRRTNEPLRDAPLLFNGKVPVHTSCDECKSWHEAYAKIVGGRFTGIVEIEANREEKKFVVVIPETTTRSLREEFANRLSQLQESCKHENTKWMSVERAPGHISGESRVCLRCEKTLETISDIEPNNPKLRKLLKQSRRLR